MARTSHRRPPRRRTGLLASLLALAAVACSRVPTPTSLDLLTQATRIEWDPAALERAGIEALLEPQDGILRWTEPLPPERWARLPETLGRNAWAATTYLHADDFFPPAEPRRLAGGDRTWEAVPFDPELARNGDVGENQVAMLGPLVTMRLPAEDSLPADLRVSQTIRLGRGEEAAAGEIALAQWSGRGLVLVPGLAYVLELPAGAGGTLSFGTLVSGYLGAAEEPHARLELRLSGDALFELDVTPTHPSSPDWHTVQVPRATGPRTLELRLTGQPMLCGVVAPRLRRSDAPPDDRPDVVLFLADTFRADNLSFYRGAPGGVAAGQSPVLDALAEGARRFSRSWSPCTWTLPSHASLFSSLYPPQHTATEPAQRLPEPAITLAEVLHEAGYRTVALTGGGYTAPQFGLGQGFESYEQTDTDFVAATKRVRKLLSHRDGRPVFAFVQTFRVHTPYHADDAALSEIEGELQRPRSFDEILADRVKTFGELRDEGQSRGLAWQNAARAHMPELRALYLAGVANFDAEFAGFLEMLGEIGLGDAVLGFTSDHGEAFGEQAYFGHNGAVWEAQTRVPMLLRGPGIEPASDDRLASLVDWAPTIAALAGAVAPESWEGADLLARAQDGQAYGFRVADVHMPGSEFRTDGRHKLVLRGPTTSEGEPPDPRLEPPEIAARRELLFDLASDPAEERPLDESAADAAQELRTFLDDDGRLEELRRPTMATAASALNDNLRRQLRALGYVDF